MKFKTEEFYEKLVSIYFLCLGILVIIHKQNEIICVIAGIIAIIINILMMVLTSFDFNDEVKPKSKLEKAEEKAIKYKYKLEDKIIKQKLKEYKLLKKRNIQMYN